MLQSRPVSIIISLVVNAYKQVNISDFFQMADDILFRSHLVPELVMNDIVV